MMLDVSASGSAGRAGVVARVVAGLVSGVMVGTVVAAFGFGRAV